MAVSAYGTTQIYSRRGTLNIEAFPVAASQSLKAGNAVYLAAGLVTGLAAGDYDTSTNPPNGVLLGVMAEDSASQAVNTLVKVHVFDDDTFLICRATGTPTVAQIGASCTMRLVATTLEIEAITGTAGSPIFKIVNVDPTDWLKRNGAKEIIGTIPANARVVVRVLQSVRQLG